MKKKLFTLLTLLCLCVTGAWGADSTPKYTNPSETLDLQAEGLSTTLSGITWTSREGNVKNGYELTSTYLVFPLQTLGYTNPSFCSKDNFNAESGVKWTATSPFSASSYFFSSDETSKKNVIKVTTTRNVAIKVTNCTEVKLYAETNVTVNVRVATNNTDPYNNFDIESIASDNDATVTTSSTGIVAISGLTASRTYIIQVVGSTSNNAKAYAIALKRAAITNKPTITTQPQSATYETGDVISALTVAATASAGDLSYQWYSCADAEKTNPQPVGTNSSSYTPSGAGYYYCKVTDSNGNVNSDVATVTVVNAFTPEISYAAPAVTITYTGSGKVYYTTDGTEPSSINGTEYSEPFNLTNSCTVRAVAKKGENYSELAKYDCYIDHTAAAVTVLNRGSAADAPTWTSSDGLYSLTSGDASNIQYYTIFSGRDGFKLNASTTYTIGIPEDIKVTSVKMVGKSRGDAANATTVSFTDCTPESSTFVKGGYIKTVEYTPTSALKYGDDLSFTVSGNQFGAYFEIYGVKRSGPADPVVVGGETITWDLSSADAWSVALKGGTFSAPSSDNDDPIRNTLYNTNQSKTITYVAGKNDSKTDTHIAPNGSTKSNARYVVLQISKDGTLGLTTNGNQGAFVVRKAANATTTWGEATDYSTTVSITTSTAGTEVTGSITYDSEKPYILIGFPDGKRNIQKITWTPASDNIELTTTDNMAGWRAFNPDGQGYTLDANTKAFIVTDTPSDNKVTLVTLAEGNQDIPGNTPVILYTTSTADSHKMTLTAKAGVDDYTGTNLLKVTTAAQDLGAGKCRLGYGANGVGFYKYAVASAPAGIVYLDAAPAQEGKGYTFVFEGETTGISNLNVNDNENIDANAPMYNLAGQRVNKSYKGVVIVNGKKMLNK